MVGVVLFAEEMRTCSVELFWTLIILLCSCFSPKSLITGLKFLIGLVIFKMDICRV